MSEAAVLELAILCESAKMGPSGRPTLIGAFSRVGAHELPAALSSRVLALELWGRPYSNVTFALRFRGPSFPDDIVSPPQDVEIGEHGFLAFGAEIGGIHLTAEGEHRIDVLDAAGEVLGGARFVVTIVAPNSP